MAEAVEALPLDPCGFEDSVIPLSEVHRAGELAVLVGEQGAVLSEVSLGSQVEDGVHSCLIQRYVPLAGGGFQLAHLHFSAAGRFCAVSAAHLFHTPLDVDDPAFQVDVAVEEAKGLPCAESCVQHEGVCCRLLVDPLSVAPGAEGFRLEFLNLRGGKGRDRLEGWCILLALGGEEVRFFDHGGCGHGVLWDDFLLGQVAEVVGEEVIDLLHGGVGQPLDHPVVEQGLDVRRGHIAHDLAPQHGVDLVFGGAFQAVIGSSLYRGELEDPEPLVHTGLDRLPGFIAGLEFPVEGGDVGGDLVLDLGFAGAGEGLPLSLALFVCVPDGAAPAVIGAFEGVAAGE